MLSGNEKSQQATNLLAYKLTAVRAIKCTQGLYPDPTAVVRRPTDKQGSSLFSRVNMYILSKAVKIDRIKITGITLDKTLYSHARACFEVLKEDNPTQFNPVTAPYFYGLDLYAKDQKLAQIGVGSTKEKHLFLSWELFPSHLGTNKELFQQFNHFVTEVVGNFAAYETAYKNGKVRHIEVAKDFISVPLDSFLPHSPLTRKPYKDTTSKCKTTHYVGKDKFTIYDKKYQLEKEKNQSCDWSNLTRLEVEEHRTGLHPWELHTLPNPFRWLECADLAALQAIQDPQFKAWLSVAQNRGETFAMRGLTPYQRRKFRACLRQCPAHWWNPEKFWEKEWGKALQAIDLQHLLQ